MMTKRVLVVCVAFLSVVACGGDTAETTSTVVATTEVSTTTAAATTTRPPPTTTTRPPTTTTTLSPPPVAAWGGDGVFELSLDFTFEPSYLMTDRTFMSNVAKAMLDAMGITVVLGADALLTFDVVGEALSASYQGVGRCYEGATITASATLSDSHHVPAVAAASATVPPPAVIFASDCAGDPESSTAYLPAFSVAATLAITDLWQAASVPMLADVLARDYERRMLWDQVAAIEAFRSLDDDAIDAVAAAKFLAAVIDLVEYLVEESENASLRDYGLAAREAAQRLLEEYAGVDHGVTTADDVAEWREWLIGWE
jgi:hypothetical protein